MLLLLVLLLLLLLFIPMKVKSLFWVVVFWVVVFWDVVFRVVVFWVVVLNVFELLPIKLFKNSSVPLLLVLVLVMGLDDASNESIKLSSSFVEFELKSLLVLFILLLVNDSTFNVLPSFINSLYLFFLIWSKYVLINPIILSKLFLVILAVTNIDIKLGKILFAIPSKLTILAISKYMSHMHMHTSLLLSVFLTFSNELSNLSLIKFWSSFVYKTFILFNISIFNVLLFVDETTCIILGNIWFLKDKESILLAMNFILLLTTNCILGTLQSIALHIKFKKYWEKSFWEICSPINCTFDIKK